MPAKSPSIPPRLEKTLRTLGERLRARRKALGINATTTAEAAGMSRVTLHRIERGEPSVAMGAYLAAISSLGLELSLIELKGLRHSGESGAKRPPSKIRLADYPQLKKLGWQLKDSKELSPDEALEIYERNWRHINIKALSPRERRLLESLLEFFGRKRLLV